jgi:branched-chain amino acid transport system ATP-binding protein
VSARQDAPAVTALSIHGVCARYGAVTVLRDVDLEVGAGQVVALLGANGAGKTTLMRTAAGVVRAAAGTVRINGKDVTRLDPNERARHGLCLIPEGRGIFRNLTVEENLRISTPPWVKPASFDTAFNAFPILKERRKQIAGTLSGGQQQMLALARASLSQASVVLVDEASMGLAPVMVDVIFEALHALAALGISLLIVEQYVKRALAMADSVYLMKKGAVTHAGHPATLEESDLMAEYLGGKPISSGGSERG